MEMKREEWDNVRETTLQTSRSVKKEREEVLETPEQRVFPCSSCWRPWWGRLSPCSPWRSTVEQISTCSPWRIPHHSRGMPEKGCDPVESPCWSRLLAGPVAPWREEPTQVCWQDLWPRGGPTLEQPVPEGLHPVEGIHTAAICEELQLVGRTHVGEVCGGLCLPWEGPHVGAGEECEELSPWGGRNSRDTVWWTDHSPHSLSPCTAEGEEVENSGVKFSLGRREGWGEGVFKIWFFFSLSCSHLIGNRWSSFFPGQVSFAHDGNWWVISPSPYVDPWDFHYIFV